MRVLNAVVFVAAMLGAGQALAGQEIVDRAHGFAVTPPDGWTTDKDADGNLMLNAPRGEAMCNILEVSLPQLADAPQAGIDAEIAKGAGMGIFERELKAEHYTYSPITSRLVQLHGQIAYIGQSDLTVDPTPLRVSKVVVLMSGRMINMNCMGPVADYARNAATIDSAMLSLRVVR